MVKQSNNRGPKVTVHVTAMPHPTPKEAIDLIAMMVLKEVLREEGIKLNHP